MKITCSACHASYNLPDEKVAGRRVKVRCKRCSEPIVVDGSGVASIPPPAEFEDEATRVMAAPTTGPNMWTVNLSESEQGDMTDEEIVAGWQAGVVTEDAYVWREGMDDWKPILDVPELVSLLSQATEAAAPPPEPSPPPAPAAVPAPPRALGSSPLGSSPQAPAPLPTPKAPPAAVTPPRTNADFFLNKPKPKREKPKYDASDARNENSMLFSLEALKAAAKETESVPPQSVRVDENMLTLGLGGGAELFNAPLIQIDAPAPPPQPATKKSASRMPAPAMAPAGLDTDFAPQKKGGKGWIIAALALAVAGGGGFFAYTNSTTSDTPVAATTTAPAETAAAAPEQTAEPSAAPEVSATAPATAEQEATTAKAPDSDRGSSSTDRGSTPSRDPQPSEPSRGSESGGSTPPSSGGGKKEEEKKEEEEAAEEAAPPFNTDAARSALSSAASQAASCKTSDGPTGSGKVQVTFVPSGRVTSANVVSGPFEGTSVGGCIARTFRQARVPKFSGDAQIVSKSFNIP